MERPRDPSADNATPIAERRGSGSVQSHFSVTGAVTRLATAGRSPPRRQPKNALHYVVEHIRCRKSARRVRRAGGGNVPTGLGLRPGAKAPDEPPHPTGYAPPLDSTCFSAAAASNWPRPYPHVFEEIHSLTRLYLERNCRLSESPAHGTRRKSRGACQCQGAEQSARVRPSGKTSAKVQAAFHECSWFVAL